MFEKRYFRYFDWINFSLTVILLAIGLLFVFSATYKAIRPFSLFFKKQFCGAISGLCIYMLVCVKDLRFFKKIGSKWDSPLKVNSENFIMGCTIDFEQSSMKDLLLQP